MNGEADCKRLDRSFQGIHLYPKFQPVVSVVRGRTIGFEGLIRGTAPDFTAVPPAALFNSARESGATLELDRKCREIILGDFAAEAARQPDCYLFLNIDTTILEYTEGSCFLQDQVLSSGIKPESIVIEVCESKMNNTGKLLRFVAKYRELGLLIALDDFGTGFSNLERIQQIKPDIIKLDRSIVRLIEQDSYKQVCLKSLVRMANTTGAIVVAEGVETEQEAYAALEQGAHLLQGYYFSRPEFLEQMNADAVTARIERVSRGFRDYMTKRIREDREQKLQLDIVLAGLLDRLSSASVQEYDTMLSDFLQTASCEKVECAYILDGNGRQMSNTVLCNETANNRKKLLFHPATVGTDHSLKEYYYLPANSGLSKFYSEPYISLATGNVCITLTHAFFDTMRRKNFLCADFFYQ